MPIKNFKIFSPAILLTLSVLTTLYCCTGCENNHGVKIGDTPPGISGNDIHGKDVTQSKLKARVVIIYFWTDSCCGDSLIQLEPLYRAYKDKGVVILAVNVGDPRETTELYAKNNALTFAMLTDEKAKLFKKYQVVGFPTVFILDKNGIVREKILGHIPIEKLEKLVKKQFKIQTEVEANYEKIHPR